MAGYTTTDPTTGRTDKQFPALDSAGVEDVLRRTHAAYPDWRGRPRSDAPRSSSASLTPTTPARRSWDD